MQISLPLRELTAEVVKLSERVGEFIREQRVDQEDIEAKSINNLVTYVDKEAEKKFVEGLETILPEAGFITEEGTRLEDDRKLKWIIDPLDGTTNYIHDLPFWCTSVALFEGDQPLLGVIHSPMTSETFHAAAGLGAGLNGESIKVSESTSLKNSLLATGFPYDDFGRQDEYMELLKALMKNSRGIRRLGSVALDLAYVACGRFESFYEYGLNPWDIAAGIIIVQEAGGRVSDFNDGQSKLYGEEIIASNNHTHDELLNYIRKYFKE